MSISHQDNVKPFFGEHTAKWEYRDVDDKFICYIVRRDKLGKKDYFPFTFQNGEWVRKWLKDEQGNSLPKPLYNIQLLKKYPIADIIIVEGEKAADKATELFPEYLCLCWMGGANAVKSIPLESLQDRNVRLMPDNDKSGYDAMEILFNRLRSIASSVTFIDTKQLMVPDKWDIGDFDDGHVEYEQLRDFVINSKTPLIKLPAFDLQSYPDLSNVVNNPRPLDTTDNLKHLLAHYKIVVQWNMMSRSRDVTIPEQSFYIEERDNASLTFVTNLAVTHDFPVKRIDKHLDALSWLNTYHPIRDWILSKPLEKPGIFNQFLQNIQTTNNGLSYILIKRWMISAIAAAFTDSGFCAQGVLVLQGPTGFRKSSFIMSLAPESMRAIKGGVSLDPTKKDDILTSSEYWLVELGELDATFRKADIARLKSHITNDIDDVRRPYAVRNSKMIRRTVYSATVNESRFLVDTTGNRRWWTISITEPIETRHGLNMQQIWRELYDMFIAGESPFLNEEEMANLTEENKQYEQRDPFSDKLESRFHWDLVKNRWMNATEVLSSIGYDKPSLSDLKRMGDILSKLELQKGTGRRRYSYLMPGLNAQFGLGDNN